MFSLDRSIGRWGLNNIIIYLHTTPRGDAQWGIMGGGRSVKMILFHNLLFMSNKAWPLKNFKDKCMNGKSNYKLNNYKSMLATIHTMFINEKIIRIHTFCPFST